MAEEGVGERIFAVRAALGDGARNPLSLRAFADRLNEAARAKGYYASQISGWETGKAQPGLDDVRLIASLDPRRRGPAWLAFGDEGPPTIPADSYGTRDQEGGEGRGRQAG